MTGATLKECHNDNPPMKHRKYTLYLLMTNIMCSLNMVPSATLYGKEINSRTLSKQLVMNKSNLLRRKNEYN